MVQGPIGTMGTKNQWKNGFRGPEDQRTRGPEDQRTRGPEGRKDQRNSVNRAPAEH